MNERSCYAIPKRPTVGAVLQPFLIVGILILLGLPIASYSAEPASMPTVNEIKKETDKAVKSAARLLTLGIDPRITAEIASDASLFVGNYCFEDQTPCDQTLYDPDVLSTLVGEYLKDASKRPATIETIASRLATRVGKSMAEVGWPSERENSIALIEVPEAARTAEIFIRTATEQSSVGNSINSILLTPGKQVLSAKLENGQSLTGTVDVAPRQLVVWEASGLARKTPIGRIEATLQQYCDPDTPPERRPAKNAPPDQAWPLDAFNWGRARFNEEPEISRQHVVAAGHQGALDITVNDEAKACDDKCQEGLSVAFAKAVAIWRSGCLRCSESAMAVIRVGSNVWLDMRAADRLRTLEQKPESYLELDLAKPAVGEVGRYFTAPGLILDKRSIVGYEQIDQDQILISTLCAIPSSESQDWVASAQGFLCVGATAPSMELRPVLTVKGGLTNCGEAAIACGLPGGEVQLSLSGYMYSIPSASGDISLGDTSVKTVTQVDLVILHEVGHWFGIPHPEVVGLPTEDIMTGVFNPNRVCVTAESLTMLNNATDDRWIYRATAKQGLILPASNSIDTLEPPSPDLDLDLELPPPPESVLDLESPPLPSTNYQR